MSTLTDQLSEIKEEVDGLMQRLSTQEKVDEANRLEKQASAADFWDDPESAQKIMQQISRFRAQVAPWQKVAARVSDALELAEMEDDELQEELTEEVEALTKIVEKMSFQAMLPSPLR